MEGIVRTNSVSTVQMAHQETQFAPRRYSNRGRQEHAKRRLLLGACERGVSRRRWKSAKSGYSAQELSNWGEGSRLKPVTCLRSKACNLSQQMQRI